MKFGIGLLMQIWNSMGNSHETKYKFLKFKMAHGSHF